MTYFVATHAAQAQCPVKPLGVAEDASGDIRRFYATARAEAFADSDESRELAASEARMLAKVMLVRESAVPRSPDGRLRGPPCQ